MDDANRNVHLIGKDVIFFVEVDDGVSNISGRVQGRSI